MTSSILLKNACIELPQATFDFHRPLPKFCGLLFLGGRAPSDAWTRTLLATLDAPSIYAVDRGVATCHRLGLAPDVLLGDADSATCEDWAWGEAHAKHIERHPVEKDFTDTQLALAHVRTERAKHAECATLLLLGAFGGRFDHAYSTIFSAAQVDAPCVLADERETIVYLHPGDTLTLSCHAAPKALSLLPMTAIVRGVTTHGLHWPLTDATLTQSMPNAVSNVLEKDTKTCTISIRDGGLAVYLCWVNR